MSIKINVGKYSRSFEILDNNEVVLEAKKPKWYSNRIEFFYTDKKYQTFEIKGKSSWSSTFNILKTGTLIGEIPYSWKKGYQLVHLLQSNKKYEMKASRKGGFFSSDKIYRVLENGENEIFAIHATYKKWKLHFDVEIFENNEVEYELLFYAFYLMRLKQAGQNGASFVAHG